MNTVCRSMLFFLVLFVLPGANAQAQPELELSEIKERFDNLLPQLMRENNIDMWIHIPEPWNPFGKSGEVDPYQLGVETGYCIFTDRDGKKIERAVFEVYFDIRASDLYDIIGEETDGMWEPGSRFAGIGKFVAERDPQRIAIDLAGISHSDYKKLSEEFGEKYTERIVSSEKLLADFRPSRGLEGDRRSRTPAAWENTIRRDRFDFLLPQAMRDNNIDLWVHVIQSWDPVDLGATSGYAVFADQGGDRIERALFSYSDDVQDAGAYDMVKVIEKSDRRFAGLKELVAKYDPKRIGVNFSERLAFADGITHEDYTLLSDAIGPEFEKRILSADILIVDFLSGKVTSELVRFGQSGEERSEYPERTFGRIVPGVTALNEVPGNVFMRNRDGRESLQDDYIIQRGDLVNTPLASAYVLREGETELPPEHQRIWDHAMVVRDILRRNIFPGRTGGETLAILAEKLEEAGYIYTDEDRYNRNGDPEKTQVHLDLHTEGVADELIGPRISPLGPDWVRELRIPLNHTFTLEYMVHMPVPEWGRGKHIYLPFHDSGVVTERGVEFPYPPIDGIYLVH